MVQTIQQKLNELALEGGMEEGQRRLVILQLESRFGELPPKVRNSLGKWNSEQLVVLGLALLTARSLKALGLE